MEQQPSQETVMTPLSSDPGTYFDALRTARILIAAYSPCSRSDYTTSLLNAILDSEEIIGRAGVMNVLNDIIHESHSNLAALAEHFMTSIYYPMRDRGGAPSTLAIPRPGGFDDVDEIASMIESQNRDQERLKMACLERDGGRCVLTRVWDEGYPGAPANEWKTPTHVVHIVPFTLGCFHENQRVSIATTWDAIYRMFPDVRSRVNFGVNNINDTQNAMIMARELHPDFGEFRFSFVATTTPNLYRIKRYRTSIRSEAFLPEYVQFTAHSGSHKLPSPELLRLHAAVAQVLHVSRLARFIDEVQKDRSMIHCLAEDGSTPISRLLLAIS